MKASHRKDVIIARIIFAIICAALLAGIISLIVWLHGRNAGKNQTPETEITNNAPPADNSNLPPVTEQPLDEDGQSVWTSTDGVNFRAEPNTDSEILTVLVTGTKLTLLGEENGWVQAEYNGQKGYVAPILHSFTQCIGSLSGKLTFGFGRNDPCVFLSSRLYK